jgi:hypothetical protein
MSMMAVMTPVMVVLSLRLRARKHNASRDREHNRQSPHDSSPCLEFCSDAPFVNSWHYYGVGTAIGQSLKPS